MTPEVFGAPQGPQYSADEAVQKIFDPQRFQIQGEISRGGMGVIYRALDRQLQRAVAIKLIGARHQSERGVVRFQREAQVLAQLRHAHIVRVHELGNAYGFLYMVLELIDGQDLFHWVREQPHGRVDDWQAVAEVFARIAEALDYCHQRGVIHRDLKPQNILIEAETKRPVLIDFGLVKGNPEQIEGVSRALTGSNETVGTPAFMSPEQMQGEKNAGPLSGATDVWGLAASLYFVLSGRSPYNSNKAHEIYKSMISGSVPRLSRIRPDLPDWLTRLISRSLSRTVAKRPAMSEFALTIDQGLGAEDILPAKPPAAPPKARSWLLPLSVVLCSVLLASLSFVAYRLWQERARSTPKPPQVSPKDSAPEALSVAWKTAVKEEQRGDRWVVWVPSGTQLRGQIQGLEKSESNPGSGVGGPRALWRAGSTLSFEDNGQRHSVSVTDTGRFVIQCPRPYFPRPLVLKGQQGERSFERTLIFENPRQGRSLDVFDFLAEMTELKHLSYVDEPAFSVVRQSSYNRKAWKAFNRTRELTKKQAPLPKDVGQFRAVRDLGSERVYTLFESDGPGCLTRLWASHSLGTLRVTVDGKSKPLFVWPAKAAFSGDIPGLPKPFAWRQNLARNGFVFPIPFQHSLRITMRISLQRKDDLETAKRFFMYHCEARRYKSSARVESISADQWERLKAVVDPLTDRYMPGVLAVTPDQVQTQQIPSKATQVLQQWRGDEPRYGFGAAVSVLAFRLRGQGKERQKQPFAVRLRVTFDGHHATIDCPLETFFASHAGQSSAHSRCVGEDSNGWLVCRWPMPFRRDVKLELINPLDRPLSVEWFWELEPYVWTERSMYFRTGFSSHARIPASAKEMQWLAVKGPGRFVGSVLTAVVPCDMVWQGGNDSFQIDRSESPDGAFQEGTSTDAFYGFQLSTLPRKAVFAARPNVADVNTPFQSCMNSPAYGSEGLVRLARWHLLDSIPFRHRFRASFGLCYKAPRVSLSYSVLSQWYGPARSEMSCGVFEPSMARLATRDELLRAVKLGEGEALIEGEDFEVKRQSWTQHTVFYGDYPKIWSQDPKNLFFSRERVLEWREAAKGRALELKCRLTSEPFSGQDWQGRKVEVVARMTRGPNHGAVEIRVNGGAGKRVDLSAKNATRSRLVSLGYTSLRGPLRLSVKVLGAGKRTKPRNRKSYNFGLDYIKVLGAGK